MTVSGAARVVGPVAWAWLVAGAACAPSVEPRVQDRARQPRPIINGTVDTHPTHNAVVSLEFTTFQGLALCTGTLIDTRVVLTAAHCVENAPAASTRVGFGPTIFGSDTQWRRAESSHAHPDYGQVAATDPPINDIAVVVLAEDPPEGVVPLPVLPASLQLTGADVGMAIEIVGYGDTQGTGPEYTKLTTAATLDWVCVTPGGCDYTDDGEYAVGAQNTIGHDQVPGGACSGDSGGPFFVVRDGVEYVAGANSYGGEECRAFNFATKVDAFGDFTGPFISGAPGSRCDADDGCDNGICSGGVCCDARCTDTCMACDVPGWRGTCHVVVDNTPCEDADPCNGVEVCASGVCGPGAPLACPAHPCATSHCEPLVGCRYTPVENGASCADDDPCDGEESCQDGACGGGTPLDCADDDPCTNDVCGRQGCEHPPARDGTDCADDDPCDGEESCQGGVCSAAEPLVCEDGNRCTSHTCDPVQGCVQAPLPDGTSLADANLCNGEETCRGGMWRAGTTLDCNDDNPCTHDGCALSTGCTHDPVPDGTACGVGTCGSLVCQAGQCLASSTDCEEDPAPGSPQSCGCTAAGGQAARGDLALVALAWAVRRARRRRS